MLPLQLCTRCTGVFSSLGAQHSIRLQLTSLRLESNCPLSSSLVPDFTLDPAVQALMAVSCTFYIHHLSDLCDTSVSLHTYSDGPFRSITWIMVICQKMLPPRKSTQTPWVISYVWARRHLTMSPGFGLIASSLREPTVLSWVVSPRKFSAPPRPTPTPVRAFRTPHGPAKMDSHLIFSDRAFLGLLNCQI